MSCFKVNNPVGITKYNSSKRSLSLKNKRKMLLWRCSSSGGVKCYLISFHSLKDGAVPAMVATATADL